MRNLKFREVGWWIPGVFGSYRPFHFSHHFMAWQQFSRCSLGPCYSECPMRQQRQHLETCWRGRILSSTLDKLSLFFSLIFIFDGHITIIHAYGVQCDILTHVYIAQKSNPGLTRSPDDLHSHPGVRSPHTICCYTEQEYKCLHCFWWWFLNIPRKGRHLCRLHKELLGRVWANSNLENRK